ncbi:MAG: response regulator [Candidatus Tectimicrobiota bacterium]
MTSEAQPGNADVRTRVFIVDDHPIVRQGLAQMINQEADLVVCGEAEEASHALEAIAALRPDLVLVDLSLKGGSGLELIKSLKTRHSSLVILVVSMHDESLYVERVLRAGARGYIMKQEATDIMLNAIRRVLRGEIYVSDKMMTRILGKLVLDTPDTASSPLERLSNRELEVFRLIGEGQSTRHIAAALHVSIKTVESHRAHIKEKLQLHDTVDLVRHAVQWVDRGRLC